MNCPLCQRSLRPDPQYPSCLTCPTKITYPHCTPISHYEFDGEVLCTSHQWYVGPFKLEIDATGLSIYKIDVLKTKPDYPAKPSVEYIMYLDIQIPIDDSNKTINKIKTFILFS